MQGAIQMPNVLRYVGYTTGTNAITMPSDWQEGISEVHIGSAAQTFAFNYAKNKSRVDVLNFGNPAASPATSIVACSIQIHPDYNTVQVLSLYWYGNDRTSEAQMYTWYRR